MAEDVKYKVAEDFKAEVKLFSGKQVSIDLMKASAKEWRLITNPKTTEEEEFAILAKVTSIKVEELAELAQPDYRMIVDAFIRLGTQPLTNPT